MAFTPATSTVELGGLMDKFVADVNAKILTTSRLFEAFYAEEGIEGVSVVQFGTMGAPASQSAVTQGSGSNLVQLSSTAKNATLTSYPARVMISHVAGGPRSYIRAVERIAGNLARTIDQNICDLFDGFTGVTAIGSGSDDITNESFFEAVASLDSTGYVGRKTAVLHPKSWMKIANDVAALYSLTFAEEFVGKGYVGTLAGCDVFQCPWVRQTGTNNGEGYINFIGFRECIGIGYRAPLIQMYQAENLEYASKEMMGELIFACAEVEDGAGVCLVDKL